ncbi:MAG: MCE family protein [Frankiaceae bacterium]|nr:MCE family protein [Frankiaceae bacterium]MBV9871874.1 MCE family protein [Frankiaceae bacterium]
MSTLASGIRVLIFTVFTVAATTLLATTIANVDNHSSRSFKALFVDASNLHSGDEVREAGVRVGTVSGISLYDNREAEVSFSVHDDVPVWTTTQFAIRYRNLIGQRYLAVLDAPEGPNQNPEQLIPDTRTSPALNLTELFNGFRPLLQGLSADQVNTLSYNLIQVLQGEGGTVDSLLTEVGSVTKSLGNRDQLIGEVIDNLNGVLGPLDQHDQQVSALIDNLQQFITGLSADRGAIGRSLTSIDQLAGTTQSLLAKARPNLKADIQHLGVLAEKLDSKQSQQIIRHFLTYTPFKLKVATPEASYGAFLNFYVCGVNFILPDGTKTQPSINQAQRCVR